MAMNSAMLREWALTCNTSAEAYGPQSRRHGRRSKASSCRTTSRHSTMFHGTPGLTPANNQKFCTVRDNVDFR
uniref:Uncharacterized protein n=1 Tax=Hyaloperonospora arabidopsidis (strain Emoy2) TaxID=559515 RepID=M4BK66_HYAAE